jgi:hypothetical protein
MSGACGPQEAGASGERLADIAGCEVVWQRDRRMQKAVLEKETSLFFKRLWTEVSFRLQRGERING